MINSQDKTTIKINEIRFEATSVLLQFTVRGIQGSAGDTTVYLRINPKENPSFRLDAMRDSAIQILRENFELLSKLPVGGKWVNEDTYETKA